MENQYSNYLKIVHKHIMYENLQNIKNIFKLSHLIFSQFLKKKDK